MVGRQGRVSFGWSIELSPVWGSISCVKSAIYSDAFIYRSREQLMNALPHMMPGEKDIPLDIGAENEGGYPRALTRVSYVQL